LSGSKVVYYSLERLVVRLSPYQ